MRALVIGVRESSGSLRDTTQLGLNSPRPGEQRACVFVGRMVDAN